MSVDKNTDAMEVKEMRTDIGQEMSEKREDCSDTDFNIDIENLNININNTQPMYLIPESATDMPDLFEV